MSRTQIVIGIIAVVASLPFARAEDKPASQPAKVQPVDYKKLKELLPEEAAGVKRSTHEGENQTMGEWSISNARAEYSKPDR